MGTHVIPAASVAEVMFRRALEIAGGFRSPAPIAAWSVAARVQEVQS